MLTRRKKETVVNDVSIQYPVSFIHSFPSDLVYTFIQWAKQLGIHSLIHSSFPHCTTLSFTDCLVHSCSLTLIRLHKTATKALIMVPDTAAIVWHLISATSFIPVVSRKVIIDHTLIHICDQVSFLSLSVCLSLSLYIYIYIYRESIWRGLNVFQEGYSASVWSYTRTNKNLYKHPRRIYSVLI